MNAPCPVPQPYKAAILDALAVLFEPADVIELRAFHKGRKRTDAGYFDGQHREALADAAVKLNAAGAAVYVTLNRIDAQLLARYCNRVENFAQATATDANVTRRRWLLIDFDPVRPKDTSAMADQLAAAKARAMACYRALKAQGWPEPIAGESGNGYHLLYPLDLPNDDESRELVKGALAEFAQRFDDDAVKVDQAVFNAGRITKLYGTVANKGDHTPLAPWRVSRLVSTPERSGAVTPDQLRALHQAKPEARPEAAFRGQGPFDLPDFMARLGIPFEQDQHEGADRYKLGHCPFNPDHGKGEAAIFQAADGRLGFKCQHNSCAGRTWHDVRALVDGPREAGERLTRNGTAPARGEAWAGPRKPASGRFCGPRLAGPLPLVAKLTPEPYPLDALPGTIRAAVEEVQGFTKAPMALIAASALGALSLAIQAHADVQRADKLAGPVALFLLTIADSGERKSTADGFFTTALRDYEAQQAEAAKPALNDYKADLDAWSVKREGIKAKLRDLAKAEKPSDRHEALLRQLEREKPLPPRVPKLLRGDETPENLAWVLCREWPSGGVVSSEAGIVFGAHGMGKDSIMRNLALLNILWDGGTLSVGRRTSESFTVKGARLTVALQVQEATLRSFFDRSGGLARGTGFLARFLVAWPESTQGYRPFTDPPPHWPALAAFNRRLAAILDQPVPIDEEGALSPLLLPLTPDTKAAWVAFHDAIEGELRNGGELYDVRDVASKSADNAARVAALFQVFEHGMGGAVGLEAFEGASRIAAWHLNESRRFFGELALPVELADAVRLDGWLIAYCRRERTLIVPRREVQRCGPNGLRDKAALEGALRELAEAGRVRVVHEGRRKEILVNPALIEGDAP